MRLVQRGRRGRQIAFGSGRDIYVMNANGSGVRWLTDGEWNDESPSWWVGE